MNDKIMNRQVTAIYTKSTIQYFHNHQSVESNYLTAVFNNNIKAENCYGLAILDTLTNKIVVAAF